MYCTLPEHDTVCKRLKDTGSFSYFSPLPTVPILKSGVQYRRCRCTGSVYYGKPCTPSDLIEVCRALIPKIELTSLHIPSYALAPILAILFVVADGIARARVETRVFACVIPDTDTAFQISWRLINVSLNSEIVNRFFLKVAE